MLKALLSFFHANPAVPSLPLSQTRITTGRIIYGANNKPVLIIDASGRVIMPPG